MQTVPPGQNLSARTQLVSVSRCSMYAMVSSIYRNNKLFPLTLRMSNVHTCKFSELWLEKSINELKPVEK